MATPHGFGRCTFGVILKSKYGSPSFVPSQGRFGYLDFLEILCSFRMVVLLMQRNCPWDLDRDRAESVDHFGQDRHFRTVKPPGRRRGSVKEASSSRLQLRSRSQGREVEPRVRLRAECGICSRFFFTYVQCITRGSRTHKNLEMYLKSPVSMSLCRLQFLSAAFCSFPGPDSRRKALTLLPRRPWVCRSVGLCGWVRHLHCGDAAFSKVRRIRRRTRPLPGDVDFDRPGKDASARLLCSLCN